MPAAKPKLEAFTVITTNGTRYQHRIGVAFHNADGSIGVVLNALPLDGRIYLRPARPSRSPASSDPDFPHD